MSIDNVAIFSLVMVCCIWMYCMCGCILIVIYDQLLFSKCMCIYNLSIYDIKCAKKDLACTHWMKILRKEKHEDCLIFIQARLKSMDYKIIFLWCCNNVFGEKI